MRTSSQDQAALEATLGPRGSLIVTSENRASVQNWLLSRGVASVVVKRMRLNELQQTYNDEIAFVALKDRQDVPPGHDGEPSPAPGGDGGSGDGLPLQGGSNGKSGKGKPEPSDELGDAMAKIAKALGKSMGPSKDELQAMMDAAAKEAVQNATPRKIEVQQPGKPPVELNDRQHPVFERVLKLLGQGAHVLLVGPAGCGKTHMSQNLAKALTAKFGAIHGTAGASESSLVGWLLPGDGGRFEYTPAPFVSLYEDGDSLFLLDELDAFDPNMLLIINGALANGHLHLPIRHGKPLATKGKDARIIATANTYGTGANPMYSGRSPLDASTLDRFIVVTMDYDTDLERDIAVSQGLKPEQAGMIWELRDKVRNAQLRRTISTRAFFKVGAMMRAGDTFKQALDFLMEGWSRDERSKVAA